MSDAVSKLKGRRYSFGYRTHERVEESPGLYCFWARGSCLYVGMSTNLRSRLEQHNNNTHSAELRKYFEAYGGEIEVSFTYEDAPVSKLRDLEAQAIAEMRPTANKKGKT